MSEKLIKVNIKDKESLKEAILNFKTQMGEVYKTGELIDKVGGFVKEDGNKFTQADVLDAEVLKLCIGFNSENYYDDQNDIFALDDSEDNYLRLSHLVVFQYALEYDEFKKLIIEFCQELIDYSMRVNSSNEMFFTDELYFGIYIITLFCDKYHEYSYMIGDFLAPDSDPDQVNYAAVAIIANFLFKYKDEEFMLDVFASSRYSNLSSDINFNFFKPFNLFEMFLDDEDKYISYKNYAFEALRRYPEDIKYKTQNHGGFISENFLSLIDVYDNYKEDEFRENSDGRDEYESIKDRLDSFDFHGRSLEEEIQSLKKEAYELVKDTRLVDLHYYDEAILNENDTLKDREEDQFFQEYDGEYDEWENTKEFFLKCFSYGERLVEYIENNKDASVLDEIEPVNIRKVAFENKTILHKRFEYFGDGVWSLSSDVENNVTPSTAIELLLLHLEGCDEDSISSFEKERALRLVDVVLKLYGAYDLDMDHILPALEKFSLCDKAEAKKRFKIRDFSNDELKRKLISLVDGESLSSSMKMDDLEEIYDIYKENPEILNSIISDIVQLSYAQRDKGIMSVVPSFDNDRYARGSHLLSVAYVIYNEYKNNFSILNDNTPLKPLIDFYEANVFESFAGVIRDEIKDYKEIEDKLSTLKEYLRPQTTKVPPQNIMMKLMQGGLESLNDEEKTILESCNPNNTKSISKDEALAILKELLCFDDTSRIGSFHYSRLHDWDDINLLLASIIYMARYTPNEIKEPLLRFYELYLELFPLQTLMVTMSNFSDASDISLFNTGTNDVENLCDILSELNIDEKYNYMLRIAAAHKANDYENTLEEFSDENGMKTLYENLITEYRQKDDNLDDLSSLQRATEEKKAKAINEAVELLDKEIKERFLTFVYKGFDDKKMKEVLKSKAEKNIHEFIRINLGYDYQYGLDTELPDDESTQKLLECKDLLSSYLFEDTSFEEVCKLFEIFKDNSLIRIDDLSADIASSSDEVIQKLFNFIYKSKNMKALKEFHKSYTDSESEETAHKIHTLVENSKQDKTFAYKFYINRYKKYSERYDFEDNPFSKIIIKNLEEIKADEELTQKSAYEIFIEQYEAQNNMDTSTYEDENDTGYFKEEVKYVAKVTAHGIFDMENPKFYPDGKIELGSYLGCNYLLSDDLFEEGKDTIDILVKAEVSDQNANIIHTDQWPNIAYKARQNQALFMAEAPHEVLEGKWKFIVSTGDKVLFEHSFYLEKASESEELSQEEEYIEEDNFDEEFEDENIKQILVDVNSVDSIKSALQKYKKFIEAENFMDQYGLDVWFLKEDRSELNIDNLESQNIEKAFEDYWGFSYGGASDEDIFFAYALKYEELKEDILEILLKIIDYAREKNYTGDLWADEDGNLIGLGTIYAFAKLYPEYTYLLGLYIIPYWDEEHAPYAIDCVESLAQDMGVCRDTLKLFCYTDHQTLRENIFDNMTEYFRENKEEYEYFKDTLKQRFTQYPYLQYSEDEIIENPVDVFYLSLLCDTYNWYDCEDTQRTEFSDFFVYDSADMEAKKLSDEIVELTGKALVSKPEKKKIEKKKSVHSFVSWQQFVENEITNGKVVWEYIYYGRDKECLNDLHKNHPNFYELVKHSEYGISEFVPDWMVNEKELFENIEQFTHRVFEWLQLNYTEVASDFILRIVDFLFEIFGRKPFEEHFIDELIEEYEVITIEEFNKRYPQDIKQRVEKELFTFLKRRWIYKEDLEKIKNSVCELEKEDPQSLIQIFDNTFYPEDKTFKNLEQTSAMLLLFAWSLKDFSNSQYAFLSLLNNTVPAFFDIMDVQAGYDVDKTLWEKMKKDIINGNEISLDDCKSIFSYHDEYEFKGLYVDFLRINDELKNILKTMFLVLKNNSFASEEISNIFKFILKLNPVHTINIISKVYLEKDSSKMDLELFMESLKGIEVSTSHIKAWEAHYYYDLYEEESSIKYINDLHKNYKDQYEEILSYLFEKQRVYYYKLAKKESLNADLLNETLYKSIKSFSLKNIKADEYITNPEDIYSHIENYFKAQIEFEDVKEYQKYFDKDGFYEEVGDYEISDTFLDMDSELRKRFLRFYLSLSRDMYEIIFKALYNKEVLLEETINTLLEYGLAVEPIVDIFTQDYNYDEELRVLSKKVDLVSIIKSYPENKRIEAVKVLERDRYFIKYMSDFKDDKSRIIRDLVSKYTQTSKSDDEKEISIEQEFENKVNKINNDLGLNKVKPYINILNSIYNKYRDIKRLFKRFF